MQQWPLSRAYFWEKAPFFRILIPFIFGIICYDQFNILNKVPIQYYLTIAAFSTTTLFIPKKKLPVSLSKTVHTTAIFISLFFAALVLSSNHDDRTKKDWFGHQVQTAEAWKVRVIDPPQEKEKTWKLKIAIQNGILGDTVKALSGKAFLYLSKDSSFCVHENDVLLIPNHFQRIKNAGNPFEMDYAGFAARENIYFQQFQPSSEMLLLRNRTAPGLLTRMHQFSLTQLSRFITDKPTLTLLQAMLVGEDKALDDDLRQAYSQTGIIHIVSISGSHVALFFYIIAALFSWLRHKKYTAIKYLVAIVPIWIYVLMAGGAPSAVRSAVMFSILTIGVVLQRDHNPLNTLFAAAFILLIINPAWLFSVGFQLSFLAVLSLVIFYGPLSQLVKPSNKILKWLWNASAASIAAELLVAPLVLYYFHSFPLMFLVANIVASICMSILLITGIALIVFCWVTPIANFVASCCYLITFVFNKIIFVLQHWSPASFNRFQFSAAEILLLYAIIAFGSIWLLLQKRQMVIAAISTSCLLTAFLIADKYYALHQQLLIVYNTGRSQNAEYISGKSYRSLLKTDSVKENFSVKNAHIGYHIDTRKMNTTDAFFVGRKKILILKSALENAHPFPVDVLVIATPLKELTFPEAISVFRPKTIVLPGGQHKKFTAAWSDSCALHHLRLHNVAQDGAYLLSRSDS